MSRWCSNQLSYAPVVSETRILQRLSGVSKGSARCCLCEGFFGQSQSSRGVCQSMFGTAAAPDARPTRSLSNGFGPSCPAGSGNGAPMVALVQGLDQCRAQADVAQRALRAGRNVYWHRFCGGRAVWMPPRDPERPAGWLGVLNGLQEKAGQVPVFSFGQSKTPEMRLRMSIPAEGDARAIRTARPALVACWLHVRTNDALQRDQRAGHALFPGAGRCGV